MTICRDMLNKLNDEFTVDDVFNELSAKKELTKPSLNTAYSYIEAFRKRKMIYSDDGHVTRGRAQYKKTELYKWQLKK